jgi:ribosomal protein S18 acetylase RimI-like enzyme
MIRRANKEDANKLDELLTMLIHDERKEYDNNINPNFVVKNWYIKYIDDESRLLLLDEEDGKITAFIYGYVVNEDNIILKKRSVLDALYVIKEYRKLGIADKLVKEFIKWSEEKDAKYFEVSVMTNNKVAKHLYEKNSFVPNRESLIYRVKGD